MKQFKNRPTSNTVSMPSRAILKTRISTQGRYQIGERRYDEDRNRICICTRERLNFAVEYKLYRQTSIDPVRFVHHSNPGKICVPSALTPSNSPPSIPNASKISGAICVVKTLCVNFCAFVILGLLTKQATFLSSALRPPCSSTFFLEVV